MFFGKTHKKIKHIIIYTLILFFSGLSFFLFDNAFSQDLMEEAFSTARSYDTIIDLGNTKDAVGNEVLRESVNVGINDNMGQGCFVNGQFVNVNKNKCTELGGDWDVQAINLNAKAPLLVRITKFLLRMTIVLSITMVIYNSIVYMVEVINGKDRKSADAKNKLIRVAGGIIISLMSVSIINLVVSVPKSSIETSDDLSSFEVGCKIGTNIVKGNDLKQYICEEISLGKPSNTMPYRSWEYIKAFSKGADKMDDRALGGYRCKICESERNDCYWTKFNNNYLESVCTNEIGGEVVK